MDGSHKKSLNFKKMKKQILTVTFFVVALFSNTTSFSQTSDINYINGSSTDCPTPTPLTCTADDELHPLPGKTYTYGVTVDPTVSTGSILWFVTDASQVINNGALTTSIEQGDGSGSYILTSESGIYNVATNTQATIDISWQSFDGTSNEVLLVAYVQGENGCSDNIEVYRIEPTFGFTLDIAGLMPDGTLPASGNANECVSPVQSATYDGTNLTMDYGENYIFFAVNAANFVGSWEPSFTIEDNTTSTAVDVSNVEWAYPDQAILSTGGTWNSATTAVDAQDPSGTVGDAGECIIVRVYLDHGANENDVAGQITLGVNGVMYNQATSDYSNTNLKDLDNPTSGTTCDNTITDEATYELNPRPSITTNTVVGTGDLDFAPKN